MMGPLIQKDIIIIGGGIIGTSIARELCKYSCAIGVIEKEPDIGWSTSKANSGIIHAGFSGDKGSLRLSLCHKGNKLFKEEAENLDIPLKNIGSLVNAFNPEELCHLELLLKQGKENGLEGLSIVQGNEKIRKIEPNISKKIDFALLAKEASIVSPYEVSIALFENSKANGVDFYFNFEVEKITFNDINKSFIIHTQSQVFESGFIINAAGLFSENIANMIGDYSFKISYYRGQYYLLDLDTNGFVNSINFQVSSGKSKGILITPTIDGNILIGPNYEKIDEVELATSAEGLAEVKEKATALFPALPMNKVITTFSGIRAVSDTNDFIIAPSKINQKFINVAGIQSPGLTCAFSIPLLIKDMLEERNVLKDKNKKFKPYRKNITRLNKSEYKKNEDLIKINNLYGEIVCRCEKISEAEVIESIIRGATTLDGIKFRTRAGMGRCQGGYCTLKLMRVLSDELNLDFEEITKKGRNSFVVTKRIE